MFIILEKMKTSFNSYEQYNTFHHPHKETAGHFCLLISGFFA